MSSCSEDVLKKRKKGVRKTLKINGEALFQREKKKDGTAAGASQMRFSLFYWLVYSIRRDRQHIDTPVVCSAAHCATQTNSARSKHSYSSMRPVCVYVCARAHAHETAWSAIQRVSRSNPTAVFLMVRVAPPESYCLASWSLIHCLDRLRFTKYRGAAKRNRHHMYAESSTWPISLPLHLCLPIFFLFVLL